MRGRIAVYNEGGRMQDERLFYSKESMRSLAHVWAHRYPAGHYVQVTIYPKGKHLLKKRYPTRIDIVVINAQKKFVRPPAIYDNQNKSLYPK